MEVELPSVDVLCHQAQPVHRAEGIFQLLQEESVKQSVLYHLNRLIYQKERVFRLLQNVPLRERVRHLVLLDDYLLLQDLDGVLKKKKIYFLFF